jgi:biopolymer transport protein ExbD
MAQLDTSQGSGKDGKVRSKKLSTRVDLTPMVDLAFLLISFFMLTITMASPVAIQFAMPKKEKTDEKKDDVKESQVLNVILDKNDVVWFYEGMDQSKMAKTSFSPDGIRKIILDKQDKVAQQFGKREKTICLIKMTDDANYKNMVDILDEMHITDNKIFAIQDVTKEETAQLAKMNGGTP